MGYIRHDAVVITTWHELDKLEEYVTQFRAGLSEGWQGLVVGPIHSVVNGDVTYFIAPDGSKEGWGDSDTGDRIRYEFLEGLDKLELYYHGIAVNYGGDNQDMVRIRILEDNLPE